MPQISRTIFRFDNPAAALRRSRPLMALESFSEMTKLVEPDEALVGAYEQDDGTPYVAWLDSLDTFATLKTYSKVVGYYALARAAAVELQPALASVVGFLPARPAAGSAQKRVKRNRANQAAQIDTNVDVNLDLGAEEAVEVDAAAEQSSDEATRWAEIEQELELFHSSANTLRRAGGYSDVVEPALLLLAIADQGRATGEVHWAADFLIRELQQNGASLYHQVRGNYLSTRGYPDHAEEVAAPAVNAALWNCLRAAREIAEATTGNEIIHVRHLLAALLRSSDEGVADVLNQLGVDAAGARDRMLSSVVSWGDDDPEWERLLSRGEVQKRLIAYDPDDPKGEDLIGISREVIALATLISARDIRPPLSVGLFGDWGSGKTFFMRQLRTAIAALSREARESVQMQKDLPFYKRIVQIEFNAWHYVEGNLWASLVEHIFRNLKIAEDDEDTVTENLQKDLLAKIGFHKAAVAAATAQEQQAAAAVEAAQRELIEAEQERDRKRKELTELNARNIKRLFDIPAIQQKLQPLLVALNLGAVTTAAADIDHALKRAETVLQQGGGVLTPLFHAQDRVLRWAKLAAAILLPTAIGLAVAWLLRGVNWAPVATALGTIATLGGTLTRWINRQTQWVNGHLRTVQSIQQEYDAELATLMQQNNAAVVLLEQQLRDLGAERDRKLQNKLEAQKALETVQSELQNATSARLLADFIVDRAESTDYRKHLGLLALVRDDFEKLSGLIDDENWKLAPVVDGEKPRASLKKFQTLDDENAEAPSRINRIVLYIDDLDRCPPNKVVEVLQAVHLLLAFPLFVVVVGVDARWVKRSLRTRYKELLHSAAARDDEEEIELIGRATADDYLEKIFQVPFWLEPMDVNGCRRMVSGLLRASMQRNKEKTGAAAPQSNGQARAVAATGQQPTPVAPVINSVPGAAPAAVAPVEPPRANIESLEIQNVELQFMNELAPVLGRSPRALKRFVNVYRLVKAELSNAEYRAFLDESHGTYRVALFLLAVDTGTPLALPDVFRAVMQQRAQTDGTDASWLVSALELAGTSDNASRLDDERRRLKEWVYERRFEPYLVNAELMARWAERIARYSFGAHALELLRAPQVQLTPLVEVQE